jgi:hypothetical protein
MRGRATTIALIAAVVLLAPVTALGGSATFTDPDDFEMAPDVQFTEKRTFLSGDGGRRVQISAGGDLGPRYRLRVLVDSLGGRHADFVMVATVSVRRRPPGRFELRRGSPARVVGGAPSRPRAGQARPMADRGARWAGFRRGARCRAGRRLVRLTAAPEGVVSSEARLDLIEHQWKGCASRGLHPCADRAWQLPSRRSWP